MTNERKVKLEIPGMPGLKFETTEASLEPSLKVPEKKIRVAPSVPGKPQVGPWDLSKAKEEDLIVPENLRDALTQEQYELIVDSTFESCDEIYTKLIEQLDAPFKAIKEFNKEENFKYLPYIADKEKLRVLVEMALSDKKKLKGELDSIRDVYKDKMLSVGVKRPEINERKSLSMIDMIQQVKTHYLVCATRIRSAIENTTYHIADFYSAMVISYYIHHPDEQPEDVREFINERLGNYIGEAFPKATAE